MHVFIDVKNGSTKQNQFMSFKELE